MSAQPAVEPQGDLLADSGAFQRLLRSFFARVRSPIVLLAFTWVGGGLVLLARLNQGWMHHDDGSIAHSAQRILAGELPHRDFAELYTGGMAFLDAAIFWTFGENLIWLRLPLLLLFLAYIPCFYALARRFVGPPGALLVTLFAISWSVPAYPAPMPTWYVLYFSVFGGYAVLRYFEGGGRRWLLLGGLFGGLSIAFKIIGVWYVVAVLVALAVARQKGSSPATGTSSTPMRFRVVVGGIALGGLCLVVAVLREKLEIAAVVSLLLPIAVLFGVILLLVFRDQIGIGSTSSRAYLRDVAVFLAGVAGPLAVLALPFVVTGSLGALLEGVLIAPQTRFDFAYRSLEDPRTLLWGLPIAAFFVVRAFVPEGRRHVVDIVGGGIVAGIVVGLSFIDAVNITYTVVWKTAHALGPLAIVGAALLLLRRRSPSEPGPSRDVALLFVLMGGLTTLFQFPFYAPIYYCYVAPLVLLAAVAALSYARLVRGAFPAIVLVVLVLFGLRFVDNQSFWTLGVVYRPDPQTAILDGDRGSVRTVPIYARDYRRVLALIRQHGTSGVMYAGPDAPELYFLADKRNPTRSILDFLDTTDSARGGALLATLRQHAVGVVVINHRPLQSVYLELRTVRQLRGLYPGGARIGSFEVRWRDVSRPWDVPSGPWRNVTSSNVVRDVALMNVRSRFIARVARLASAFRGAGPPA